MRLPNIPFHRILGRHNLSSLPNYESLLIDKDGPVALIRLNRPKARNALNSQLMEELQSLLTAINKNREIKVAVITGQESCFAAGADIAEMNNLDFPSCLQSDYLANWTDMFRAFKKPIIAAVNGFALGGGCEVALMCDIVYAGENAKFSQPEIKLGTIPGGGATQRLPRAVGKSKAMELILTGRHITATEALQMGIVSRVFPTSETVTQAMETAKQIAAYSGPVINLCKQAVNMAFEMPLSQGLAYERNIFHQTFSLNDRREGMSSFLAKRAPEFKDS